MAIFDAKAPGRQGGLGRRAALGSMAAAGAALAAPARVWAQDASIRWWSPQASPAQLAAYQTQIDPFEAAHPGVKVAF